jgi:hypothetical protein
MPFQTWRDTHSAASRPETLIRERYWPRGKKASGVFVSIMSYRKYAYLTPAARRFIEILKAQAKEIAKKP